MKARFRLWPNRDDSPKRRFWLCLIYLCLCIAAISGIIAGLPRLGVSAASKPKSHPTPTVISDCNPGWVYNDVSVLAYPFMQFGPVYQNYNGTKYDESYTFSSWVQGRVEVRVDRGLLVNFNTILFGVTRTTNKGVEREIELNVGNTVTVTGPAHRSVYARYGVYQIQARGHYFFQDKSCHALIDEGFITSWCPWYSGWSTWVVNPDPREVKK